MSLCDQNNRQNNKPLECLQMRAGTTKLTESTEPTELTELTELTETSETADAARSLRLRNIQAYSTRMSSALPPKPSKFGNLKIGAQLREKVELVT